MNAGKRGRYRNKAQYPISVDGSVGLYAARSHRIVSCSDCLLQPVEFSAAAAVLGKWIRANNVTVYDEGRKTGLVRHLCLRKAEATGELMAVLVINGNSIPKRGDLISGLLDVFGDNLGSIQLNINTDDTNVIMGKKCITIYGKSFITDKICGIDVRISALSFYQVNREMAERLYKKAAEYACPENRTVLDLYCGIGTIGLTMAKKAQKIIGVELIEEAVADARVNAEQNGIYNAEFICADASEAVKNFNENGLKPDTIIVDPPRKGCYEQVIEIMASGFSPERIVYISCDPATLARDTAMLADRGYKLSEYTPFDLFPGTAHIETAALFIKKDDGNTAE